MPKSAERKNLNNPMNDQWLFVSDVDDTLLGDDAALIRLMRHLAAARKHIIIVYNSSRPCASLRQTLDRTPAMLTPQYLVGAMGTEIQVEATAEPVHDYIESLSHGWDREKIDDMVASFGFVPHAPRYQAHYKVSYDIPGVEAYRQIKAALGATGLQAKAIFSGGKNLDIIHRDAGKGAAVHFLRRHLQVAIDRVVVAGDSGNDADMFTPTNKGIVVGNAAPELKQLVGAQVYHAQQTHANGVLEGLHHWGIL